jgi:hypothetical protein
MIKMNIRDFINYIITFNDVDEILNSYKTQTEKGFIFERLFDIIIKFGFCDKFTNSNFIHLIGNVNNGILNVLQDFNQYLDENVISGNSGGCSDITLQNRHNNTYIFISSKYPKTSEDKKKTKSVSYYDIQHIVANATKHKTIYKQYKIYLAVPDKNKLLDKVNKSNKSSKYITEHITNDTILDKTDLNRYFIAFKDSIIENKNSNWFNRYNIVIQCLLDRPKELLELISDCLKPKIVEKKKYGEVFTPMDFINDKMLKNIEEYWLINKNENI